MMPGNPCDACRAHGATSCSCRKQWLEEQDRPTGHRVRVVELREAGKPPAGERCPECGPHGNRGAVMLLWSVVHCIECGRRANVVAGAEGHRLLDEVANEIRGDGCEPLAATLLEVDLLDYDNEHPWQRRVTVTVPYRHAQKVKIDLSADTSRTQAAFDALTSGMRKAFGVP